MTLAKSIKMYLTIFVATTCIYMVLYQYHISRQPIPAEIIRNKELSADEAAEESSPMSAQTTAKNVNDFVRRYNLFLWSPMSVFGGSQRQQQQQQHQKLQQQQDELILNATKVAVHEVVTSSSSMPPQPPSYFSSSLSSTMREKELKIKQKDIKEQQQQRKDFSTDLDNQILNQHHLHQHSNHDQEVFNNNNNNNRNSTTSTTTITTIATTRSTTTTRAATSSSSSSIASSIPIVATLFSSKKSLPSISYSSFASYPTTTFKIIPKPTTNQLDSKSNSRNARKFDADATPPPLYIITPTYRRPEQLAELTRLGYTLKHIVNLLWLVIEDANETSPLVTQTLNRIGVPFEYLVAPMPEEYKKTKKAKPRGVSNRNRGLRWLRENATEGVFYFADDDNTYDISIFEQMRYTKKVSMWPVGLVTKFGVSSPIIRKGKIDGFYDGWVGGRKYAVDMAGFAVSVKFLHQRPAAKMPFKPGYEEDGFLKSLAPLNHTDIELLASECTEILTWHTQTKKNPPAERLNMTKYGDTNLVSINKVLVRP